VAAVVLAVGASVTAAQASVSWSFGATFGGDTASPTVTTSAFNGADYLTAGTAGTVEGTQALAGLLPIGSRGSAGTSENELFSNRQFFGMFGFAFSVPAGPNENFSAANGDPAAFYDYNASNYHAGAFAAVPEPASAGLFGVAVAGLALLRRRRRRTA
jgi:hypothetical protein